MGNKIHMARRKNRQLWSKREGDPLTDAFYRLEETKLILIQKLFS